MNILKSAIIIVISLLIISVVIYLIPFEDILSRIPIFSSLYNNTSLNINSKNGKAIIKINGESFGETPLSIDNLKPGEYEVEMERISNQPEFYDKKLLKVTLERGTETIIDYELGPKGISSGYILYYTRAYKSVSNKGLLTVLVDQGKANILLDGEYYNVTPINSTELNSKNYQLKITKDGYEDLSFPIIIRNGYNLNIQASLYPLPTVIKK